MKKRIWSWNTENQNQTNKCYNLTSGLWVKQGVMYPNKPPKQIPRTKHYPRLIKLSFLNRILSGDACMLLYRCRLPPKSSLYSFFSWYKWDICGTIAFIGEAAKKTLFLVARSQRPFLGSFFLFSLVSQPFYSEVVLKKNLFQVVFKI